MRAFCTVSAPLEVCAAPTRTLLPGSRFLALKLLGTPQPRTLYFLVEAKSRVREVYTQTCLHFARQGMLDTELFGLAVPIDGDYLFADPESKLSKYGPKSWRSSHTHGLDANGRPLLEFHFRVQFYIESPLMLRDETSRHNYYLQLKSNTVNQDIPKDCTEQSFIVLGALALQADLGDCPDDNNATTSTTDDYFKLDDYIPSSLRTTWSVSALKSCHKDYRGMSRADAETNYIKEACILNDAINAHVFKMKLTKNESGLGSVWFAVYAKGIKIFGEQYQATNFLWPNISKLSFERKKFEIKCGEQKTVLYSTSDVKNKKLFSLCKDTHQFSMKIATRLNDAIRREEEECSTMHVCDMYSRNLNLPYKNKNDQRISVISSTSSNTTSGIVSDRVHSEDELEIMINASPPGASNIAAPSTESLALAHLLDKPSVSRQTSSVNESSRKLLGRPIARSASNESTSEQQLNERKKESSETDSPNSQHNVGSQCSSTCSTIVVTTTTENSPQSTILQETNSRRRPSTSSSLELGFSHTAQNSIAISESTTTSVDVTYGNNTGDESMSGMYTLNNPAMTETSGVYTMSNSELTGQSSEMAESESHESSYYGSFQPNSEMGCESTMNVDSVDGNFQPTSTEGSSNDFRLRSDSNVSTASFRGDGSDPTDKKQALLSAEELTDLIVGRGTYPSRKTVSNTLDSDCDYVTMPLPLKEGESFLQGHEDTAPSDDNFDMDLMSTNPPMPPIRIDSNNHRAFSGLINQTNRNIPPPPYNAPHNITSIPASVPEKREEIPPIPARDPPPYPQQSNLNAMLNNSTTSLASSTPSNPTSSAAMTGEAGARFITTRPAINILKAHTSIVGENQIKPSYAASVKPVLHHSPSPNLLTSTIGIPYTVHKNLPPYTEVKTAPVPSRTCVLLPVIKQAQHIPPPPRIPRQPPPAPPIGHATVYTSQLAQSQIELYQKQLYSDVDYVIYPIQDPAISQQDYIDAKQSSIIAAMAQNPPIPPYLAIHANHGTWDAYKGHAIYRSTPYLSMAYSTHSRYASTQNLSDTYVQLPSGAYSPLYSPSIASLCSSYDAPPPIPMRSRPISTAQMFTRSQSDDCLNAFETMPKVRQPPPIPSRPPPYNYKKKPLKPPMPIPIEEPASFNQPIHNVPRSRVEIPVTTLPRTHASMKTTTNTNTIPKPVVTSTSATSIAEPSPIDLNVLRERSKHLDLPLISALCNDRTLQTAFVMPKHPSSPVKQMNNNTLQSSKGRYPVSGLSTTQLTKPRPKTSISHRHPNDKLPPLPNDKMPSIQTTITTGNNYVMDPAAIKLKIFSSQPNLKPA